VQLERFLQMPSAERKAMPFKESARLYAEAMANNLRENTRERLPGEPLPRVTP
jgi:hypothetical protein